jgi:hypothetical protein
MTRKNLEKLVNEGSSTVYFSINPSVPSNELWTKGNGLERAIGTKEIRDAVTIIGIRKDKKDRESYFTHGVYEIMPFDENGVNSIDKEEDKKKYKEVYDSMIPGVAYMNPSSFGITPDDFNKMDRDTGPVKNGNREFLGVINLDYLVGLDRGKINQYFINGAYLNMKPTNQNGKYVQPTGKYSVMKNVGRGAGLISRSITDKIAERNGFPKPMPGEIVIGIGYFEDRLLSYKKLEPYAFPLVVSAEGDKMQVPTDAINSMYFEVILGFDRSTGKKLIA